MSYIDEQIERFRQTESNVPRIIDLDELDAPPQVTVNRRYIRVEDIGSTQGYYTSDQQVAKRYTNKELSANKNILQHDTYREASKDIMRYSYHEEMDQPVSYENNKRFSRSSQQNDSSLLSTSIPTKTLIAKQVSKLKPTPKPSLIDRIDAKVEVVDEEDNETEPKFEEITIEKVEEFLKNSKWKWRKVTYEALNELLYDNQEKIIDIVERNMSSIMGEKNLAAFEQALKLVKNILECSNNSRNFDQFVVDRLIETSAHKKFLDIYADIIAIIFRRDSQLVINSLYKRLDSNDLSIQLYILNMLAMIIIRINIDNSSILKSLIFKLKGFLKMKNAKVKEKALQIITELMTYVSDDFNDLESSVFTELTANQSKLLKNSWAKPKKGNNSFYILEGVPINKNNSSIALFGNSNQNGSMYPQNNSEIMIPDKFFEIPYAKKIDDKKDILNEFLTNLKKTKVLFNFSSVSANTATLFNILVDELSESNYLIYSAALEILTLLTRNKPDNNLINSPIVKRMISESATKYSSKANINDLIMELIDNVIANRHIKISTFFPFVMNEIKFNKSLNVKICYLDWFTNNLKKYLNDPEIREFSGGRIGSTKDLNTLTKRQSTKRLDITIIDYTVDQLNEILKEEKTVKIQNIIKAHIQEMKNIDISDLHLEKTPVRVKNSTQDLEKFKFYMKNVKIPTDSKNQLLVLETCMGLVLNIDTNDEVIATNIFDFLDRFNSAISTLTSDILELEIKILITIKCLSKFASELKSILLFYLEKSIPDMIIKILVNELDNYKDNVQIISNLFSKFIEQTHHNTNDENFFTSCKKGLRYLTTLSDKYKAILYSLIEVLEEIVLPMNPRIKPKVEILEEPVIIEKTPLDILIDHMSCVASMTSLNYFNKTVSNDLKLLQELNSKIKFSTISGPIENVVLNVFNHNLQDPVPLAEFIVVLLSLLDESGKDKFYVFILSYCGKEDFCSSMLIYPFITTVKDIFRCFRFAFHIVRNNFNEKSQTNYIKNILPVYLSIFEDNEINIANKRLMHLAEAIVYGTNCIMTSSTCKNIIDKLIERNGIDDVKKKFEVELQSSGHIYNMFVDLVDKYEEPAPVDVWKLNRIETNKSYSIQMNGESVNIFTNPVEYNDSNDLENKKGETEREEDNRSINQPDVISVEDEDIVNASVMYYENIKIENINEIQRDDDISLEEDKNNSIFNINDNINEIINYEIKPSIQEPLSHHDELINLEYNEPETEINNITENNHDEIIIQKYYEKREIVKHSLTTKDSSMQTEGDNTDFKPLYEREQQSHKKTIQQLYTITSKYDELTLNYQSLKDQVSFLENKSKIVSYIITSFDEEFFKKLFTSHIPFDVYQDVIKRCNQMPDYEREKFIFDLKFQVTTESILDFLNPENYEAFLRFVLHMVIINTIKDNNANIQALMHRILDASIKIPNISMVIYSLISIFNKEIISGQSISSNSKMLVKLGLRCIEKLLDYSQNTQSQVNPITDTFTILKNLYIFFKDHPPEDLTDDTEDLTFFNDILVKLKETADRLINVQPSQAKVFLVVFGEEKSVFITYMKKLLADIEDN